MLGYRLIRCGGAALRGGDWNNGTNDGVLTLNMNNAPSNVNSNVGFRCVLGTFRRCVLLGRET
ncbi:MAG: hypothetical protein JST16_05130 [Bdellovibrionales bacterium]|nr:hypothetical protein [Bdellovibrionales bacterium]